MDETQSSYEPKNKASSETITKTALEQFNADVLVLPLPEDATIGAVKALSSQLASEKKKINGTEEYFQYNTRKGRMIKRDWGSLIYIPGQQGDSQKSTTILMDNDQHLLGYGGSSRDDTGELSVSMRLFTAGRERLLRRGVKATTIMKDKILADIVIPEQRISRVTVPTEQQYNPAITDKVTAAPLAYRKLGFSSNQDSSIEREYAATEAIIGEEDLKTLASHPLQLDISYNRIPLRIGADSEVGTEVNGLVRNQRAVTATESRPPSKTALEQLAARLRSS